MQTYTYIVKRIRVMKYKDPGSYKKRLRKNPRSSHVECVSVLYGKNFEK